MRYEALIAAILVLSQIAISPAGAESGDHGASPQFTAAETRTVGRNELLRTLMETDPWLVRQILDAVAQRSATGDDEFVNSALDGIDRTNNPDLVTATKSAAASVEWITLLRRARDEKAAGKPAARSAKGSVEMLELLKQAKKEKGSGK